MTTKRPFYVDFRVLLSTLAVLITILLAVPTSPAQPVATRAQPEDPFPPQGDWYTYANGDDILDLQAQGDVLWSATRAGGLVRWDTTDGSFIQFLDPQDGLVGNTVRDIFIDPNGHKWLATDRGLSVLDDNDTGAKSDDTWYTYTRATTGGALSSDRVTAVAMDGDGYLWIGTAQYWDDVEGLYVGGGLVRLDTQGNLDPADDVVFQTYTLADTLYSEGANVMLGLASDNVTAIVPVADNQIWVATQKHWEWQEADDVTTEGWRQLYGGLSLLNHAGTPETDDDEWKTWTCETGPQSSTAVHCIINDLMLDPATGYVWAAQRGRSVLAFPAQYDFELDAVVFDESDGLATTAVDTIAFGPPDDQEWQHTVWFGVYNSTVDTGRGVCVLDHKGTVADKPDDVWNGGSVSCLTTGDGLPDNRIQAIAAGADRMWFGAGGMFGYAHGIASFDLDQQAIQDHYTTAGTTIPYNYISDVAVGDPLTSWADHIWVGTGNMIEHLYGVGALVLDTHGSHDPSDDTWTQYTRDGTDDNGTAPWTGLGSDNVTAVAIDGDNVWLGTQPVTWVTQQSGGYWIDGGLSVFDGDQWTLRTDANTGGEYSGMYDDRVSDVTVGCNGEIWIALGSLRDNSAVGIHRLDTGGAVHDRGNDLWAGLLRYSTIPSSLVTDMAPDCKRANMWIATAPYFNGYYTIGGGVARFDYANGGWTKWTTDDGIESFDGERTTADMRSIAVGPDGVVYAGALGDKELTTGDLIGSRPWLPAALNWFTGWAWFSHIFENGGWVSAIAVDEDGIAWVGTSRGGLDADGDGAEDDTLAGRFNGGLSLTRDRSEWVTWSPAASDVPVDDIAAIEVAPNGDVWLATNGWGLVRFHPREPGQTPTVTPTRTLTPTPTSTPVEPTITPTPTGVQPRIGSVFLPVVAKNWLSRPLSTPTAVPSPPTPTMSPTATISPTLEPPTSTPAPPSPTPLPPTIALTPTATPTATITPTPQPGTWCSGGGSACLGVSLPSFPTNDLRAIDFADAVLGGEPNGLIVGEDGFVARTTDGGSTWTTSSIGSASLRDVSMADDQVAFVVGDDKGIWRTTDSGVSFAPMQLPAPILDREDDFWAVYAVAPDDAWVMGRELGLILHWDGQAWNLVSSSVGTGIRYTGLAMPDSNTGWAIAEDQNVYRYNGSWALWAFHSFGGPLRAIEFWSASSGWVGADFGVVGRYNDGAWSESRISRAFYSGGITDIDAVSQDEAWAVASLDTGPSAQGAIFHYSDGAWSEVAGTPLGPLYGIWVDDAGTNGWAVGRDGLVMRYVR